ncbi:hypothetical protein Tco_0177990, partial [Tanacetum coccineum]
QEINDDEEESDDEFVQTPLNYVPTGDETNDESNDVDEEECEQDDEGEEDADMKDVAHAQDDKTQEQTTGVQEESGPKMASVQGQYVVQATTTATAAIQNATTEVPLFSSSHSISSNYTSAFLNLENLQSTKSEVVSMLDINVQHGVPRTSPLLTILVSVILEHTVFNPSETVTTAPATTITSLLSSLFPNLHQSILIPTPINTEATTLTPSVLESKTLNVIHLRLSDLEKKSKSSRMLITLQHSIQKSNLKSKCCQRVPWNKSV